MTIHADEPSAPGDGASANDLTSRAARRSAELGGTLRPRRLPTPAASGWAPPAPAQPRQTPPTPQPAESTPTAPTSPAAAPAPAFPSSARAVPIVTTGAATAASPEQQRYYLCCEVPSGDFVEVIVAVTDGARRRYFTTSDGARLVEVDEDYFVHRSLGDARSLLELDAREMAELEAELGFVRTVRGRDPLAEVELEAPAVENAEPDASGAAPIAGPEPVAVIEEIQPAASESQVELALQPEPAAPAPAVSEPELELEPEFEFGFDSLFDPAPAVEARPAPTIEEPVAEPAPEPLLEPEPLLASLLPVAPVDAELDDHEMREASAPAEPEPLRVAPEVEWPFDAEPDPEPAAAPVAGTPWWLAPAPAAAAPIERPADVAPPAADPMPQPAEVAPQATDPMPQPAEVAPPAADPMPQPAGAWPAQTDQTERTDVNEETDRMVTGTTNAFEPAGAGAPVTPIWAVEPLPDADAVVAAAAQVALAKGIAFVAHRGQTDKVGAAYIDHPGRVAERFDPIAEPVATSAAWLHDVLEDTGLTARELLEAGVLPEVVEVVVLLTRTPEVPEAEYYGRIRRHAIARSVKIADVDDNSAAWRVRKLDFETQQRLAEKYRHAREMLGA
ncbi:hypothetical protein [Agromyces sp. S2-1-8]|uniref:hypothetical protein n=1 Tax=Agromyces sp. S2-1-8 TaxID=2897180 RepID=UPI001E3FA663|nr:hypothetical protein [Agromyces sp. S2-1-8]MCD5346001.1 hypothetical protein [Agromyces sp. S2-1-8]